MAAIFPQGEVEEGAALPLALDDPFEVLAGLRIGAEAQQVPATFLVTTDKAPRADFADRRESPLEFANVERADDGKVLGHLLLV